MKPTNLQLEERLSRLEKQNRHLKRFTGAFVALIAAVGLMSAAFPDTANTLCKTIWAERFILKDAHMNERMLLDAYSYDSPRMIVKDEDGKMVAELAFGSNGRTTLKTRDAKGKTSKPVVIWGPQDKDLERADGVLF